MAVAQSSTLTRASKQLGLAQPSLSQQLAKLEESVGTRLFDRSHNRMVLTDAGQVLVRHAQAVLKEIDEAEASLRQFSSGKRSIIRIAGLTDSVAQSSVGFRQVPIVEDPYVFAVPSSIGLGEVRELEAMPADARRVLNSCIQFHFGTPHTLRIQQWYQRVLPSHRTVAHCRTYEVALGLVHAGFGVCLLPALTAFLVEGALHGIDFFATDHGTRRTVAMVADQYLRIAPFKGFIEALQAAGRNIVLPPIKPWPELIEAAAEPCSPTT
jgi:DNA-binding transcriptional LysR family regulator